MTMNDQMLKFLAVAGAMLFSILVVSGIFTFLDLPPGGSQLVFATMIAGGTAIDLHTRLQQWSKQK